MARVILITTREIDNVLAGFDSVQPINSNNYNKAFFVVEDGVSALNRFLTEQKHFKNSQFNIDTNEDDRELSAILAERALSSNYNVKQMFDALLYGTNINLLGNASYPNINKVREGILRINETNIFICHEWFSNTVFLRNDTDGLVEKTRKAYFKAIVEDIRCALGENTYEWVVLVHDKDFGVSGCYEVNEDIESVGFESDKTVIWTYQHSEANYLCNQFIRNNRVDKFDILINSIDIRKTLKDIVYPNFQSNTSQEEIGTSNNIEIISNKNGYYTLIDCNALCKKIQLDRKIDINKAEEVIADAIVDMVANYQRTEKLDIRNLEKDVSTGKISIDSNQIIKKPIIIYWEGKSLSKISDKRRDYLDCSIWVRYADSSDKLEKIKNELEKYSALYKTANAIEVKEFKARMALNSFLIDVLDAKTESVHGQFIAPFIFHSETAMNDLVYKNKKDENNNKIAKSSLKTKLFEYTNKAQNGKLKWRLLLVDDNAFNSDVNNTTKVQKCKVITDILRKDFCVVCINGDKDMVEECPNQNKWCPICASNNSNATIYIDCVRSKQEAHKKLKERRYDIVLLDYLLGGKNQREYGTDLLTELKIHYEDQIRNKAELSEENLKTLKQYIKAKGPFGKFWIFFVSTFSNAISEKMLSEGMHYNTDYWYIARGACPTTTPELFRYNLYSLFYQQIKSITNVSTVKADDDDSKVDSSVITLIDLLNYIFAEATSIRERASKNFNSLLHLRAHYDILKRDFYMGGKDNPDAEKNGSPLIQALFADIKHYSNAFWEHTQHLIYLIAFGNIRQWNEMWDEYIFIKDILRKAIVDEAESKLKNQDNQNEQEKQENLVRKIEKYIIEIKNTNHR